MYLYQCGKYISIAVTILYTPVVVNTHIATFVANFGPNSLHVNYACTVTPICSKSYVHVGNSMFRDQCGEVM